MKLTIILLFITILNSNAQEYPISDVLYADMLELGSGLRANRIVNKLWQLEVEAEAQEGYLQNVVYKQDDYLQNVIYKKRYYIEIQDISILEVEYQKRLLFWTYWRRMFGRRLKKKLIRIEFE